MPNEVVTIAIAGMSIAFRIRDARLRSRVRRRYAGYLGRPPADLALECRCSTGMSGGRGVRLASAGDGGWTASRGDFECRWKGAAGELRLRPSLYAFDAGLRVLLSVCLPMRGALLVHGSAVVGRQDRAVLFLGPSGSGKTTAARLCRCTCILNDEICAVTTDRRGRLSVSATPFWGEMGTGPAVPGLHPVFRIFLLRKAAATREVSLPPDRALAAVLRCVCIQGRRLEHAGVTLERACAIVASGLVRELQFRKAAFDPFGLISAS